MIIKRSMVVLLATLLLAVGLVGCSDSEPAMVSSATQSATDYEAPDSDKAKDKNEDTEKSENPSENSSEEATK